MIFETFNYRTLECDAEITSIALRGEGHMVNF